MESTVTTKNMTSIPQALARRLGIKPGWKLDWQEGDKADEMKVRVIPDRAERGRRLLGSGSFLSPEHSAVDDLVTEREQEG
jgi:bifunctional DNA-binding transcriptional regulator/antitoxin component of YhaV-PrlF toxin-antitoxin module